MTIKEQVLANLEKVELPGVKRSLPKMNLVREITDKDGDINIVLETASVSEAFQERLKEEIVKATHGIEGLKKININFEESKPKDVNNVKNVIAIMSGKGGVGKSLVAGLSAVSLRRQGYEVGILDADITGPSIPKMFGIKDRPEGSENGILPVSSKSGIEMMSINLLLPGEDQAVIWRGPIIAKAITQFWEDVLWGNLDCLVVDLPPGTADAPLTVLQTLPVSGIVIVTSPQDLATMVVKKAVNMAKQMSKPIIGVVENMSYLYVQEIDKKIELFGKSRGEEIAKAAGAPFLGQLPIDPRLAKLCDEGSIEDYDSENVGNLSKALTEVIFPETK